MFNNMKNKIREKTGTELPKFIPNSRFSPNSRLSPLSPNFKLSGNSTTSSRHGSETSLNSLSCPITDINSNSGHLIQKTSDFREIDESSYNEWLKKEKYFQLMLLEKEAEWRKKEQDYRGQLEAKEKELVKATKQVEEYKGNIFRYQEDKDQLEQYQLQEMAKIKHLLLSKEKENADNSAALKESVALVESLKHEVTRLRPLEEQISNYESSTESDSGAKYQDMARELEEVRQKLEDSEIQSSHTNEQLKIDVQSLMRSLDDEKLKVRELEQSLSEERRQRDEAFLRNAQMSQQVQLAQCDLRNSQQENDELQAQLNSMDNQKQELSELRSQVTNITGLTELQNELNEKNNTIRILQQRLSDIKKTLQQELRNNASESQNTTSGEDTPPTQAVAPSTSANAKLEEDVNFKYLKHVIIKFLTCRDYEAQHLTRAVAVLLHLSAEEEQCLKDNLDMRASWWPSRPRILPR